MMWRRKKQQQEKPVVVGSLFSTKAREKVFVLNSGSSSLKFGLFERSVKQSGVLTLLAGGMVEELGSAHASITLQRDGGERQRLPEAGLSHETGLRRVVDLLGDDLQDVAVVSHRVVHGGLEFSAPTLVTKGVLAAIQRCAKLAPLHNPANMRGIEVAREVFGDIPQVAVFDTAFHTTMKPEAFRYAVSQKLYDAPFGIRKYGFHGTSYAHIVRGVSKKFPDHSSRMIICHLGNGASMCCVRDGECVDTSMGLTPLEGLVMGTRSGDVDPSITSHLCANHGMKPAEVDRILNKESGLLGVSGVSSDWRVVSKGARDGDEKCVLARALFVERIRKYLGAYLVKLRGEVDSLVFTAGIGENDAWLRSEVCSGLASLGVVIDAEKNASGCCEEIQADFSRTKILVVPTDEEREIARQAFDCVDDGKKREQEEEEPQEEQLVVTAPAPAPVRAARAVYVDGAGRTTADELGLMYTLFPLVERLGYFRPIAGRSSGDEDAKLKLIRALFPPAFPLQQQQYGATGAEAEALLKEGREEDLLEVIQTKFMEYASAFDFVVVSRGRWGRGSTDSECGPAWSAKLAERLSLPVVYVAKDLLGDEGTSLLRAALEAYAQRSVAVSGVIAQLPRGFVDFEKSAALVESAKQLITRAGAPLAALLPSDERFHEITVAELAEALGADVIFGKQHATDSVVDVVDGVCLATVDSSRLIERVSRRKRGQLVIVDSSRSDVLLSLALAHASGAFPPIAAIVLCGGESTPPCAYEVMTALEQSSPMKLPPVLHLEMMDAFGAAHAVRTSRPMLLASSTRKILAAQRLFENQLEPSFVESLLPKLCPTIFNVTPSLFKHSLNVRARSKPQRIVFPEGDDPRVLEAIAKLAQRGLCLCTILGDPKAVNELAEQVVRLHHHHTTDSAHATEDAQDGSTERMDIRMLPGVQIIDPTALNDEEMRPFVTALVEARKHKGLTPVDAGRMLRDDANYFGTVMVARGLADGMVSGARHSTASTIRPALQIIKLAPGYKKASSSFFMLFPDGVKLFADCAINVSPTAEDLAEIAGATAQTARQYGIAPRVAMLSYATGSSNNSAMVDKVREATELARASLADTPLEGPIQYDAAVDPDVAATKFGDVERSTAAGHASVLIFPTLDAGNSAYKAAQQASKAVAIGPIMQGLRKPVNDLSRGATVEDIVNTAVATSIQAQAAKAAAA